jgi:hypothetical protein
MGDRAWAKIQIGGKLPKSKLHDFEELLKDKYFLEEGQTYKDILVGDPGILEHENESVNYALFDVEDELRKLNLTYYKEYAAGDEYAAGKEYWKPGMSDYRTAAMDEAGEEFIDVSTLLEMIEKVERVSKNLKDLPLHINDDDKQMQHIVKYYTSTPKKKAKPMECLKAYVQKFIVPTYVPPFEIVEG